MTKPSYLVLKREIQDVVQGSSHLLSNPLGEHYYLGSDPGRYLEKLSILGPPVKIQIRDLSWGDIPTSNLPPKSSKYKQWRWVSVRPVNYERAGRCLDILNRIGGEYAKSDPKYRTRGVELKKRLRSFRIDLEQLK